MVEIVRHVPKPIVLGSTEFNPQRRTYFKIQLINSSDQIIDDSIRFEGLEELETWGADKDKIFFYSPFSKGVLVCDIKSTEQAKIKVYDKSKELTAYAVGTHADIWFNTLLNTPDLRVIARSIPSLL